MRYLLASFVLSLLLSCGASLPAAADPKIARWSEGISLFGTANPAERPTSCPGQLQRSSTMTTKSGRGAAYHRNDGASRQRYTKRRHARVAKHTRRHQRTHPQSLASAGTRPSIRAKSRPQRTVTAPAVQPATPPAWSKKGPGTDSQKRPGSRGMASFYWQPQAVASGGRFNPNAMTAAHKTLPFGTRVRVTHMGNGRSVEVKINDRGPYVAGRIIDLSKAAAGVIGMTAQGVARVAVEVLGR